MPLNLASIADERSQQLESAISEASTKGNDTVALHLLLNALSEVRDSIAEVAIEEVNVTNLDEIKASLRNELNKISKPILSAIDKLSLDKGRLEAIKQKIEADNAVALNETHDIQIIRKPKQRLEISNLTDIAFPDEVGVRNLSELQAYFNDLSEVIKDTFNIEIPTPQVTVNPPQVNVPEIKIPESAVNIDVQSIIDALGPLKFLSDKPTKAVSVRLSNGKKFLNTIRTMVENQEKQLQSFSQGLNEAGARKAFKQALSQADMSNGTAGGKALTDATAGVALASNTAASIVDLTCYGGLMAIGDSTSVRADSSSAGVILTPGSRFYRVHCSNLNQIFVSGATGTRACYIYYT